MDVVSVSLRKVQHLWTKFIYDIRKVAHLEQLVHHGLVTVPQLAQMAAERLGLVRQF